MALNVRFEDFSGADPLEAELALEFPEGDICEHAFPFAEEPGCSSTATRSPASA